MANEKLILQKLESLELLMKSLESKVAALDSAQGWRQNVGSAANDPLYQQAIREDRELWARERERDKAKIDREIARDKVKAKKKPRSKSAA